MVSEKGCPPLTAGGYLVHAEPKEEKNSQSLLSLELNNIRGRFNNIGVPHIKGAFFC